jgi:hypothetical protein
MASIPNSCLTKRLSLKIICTRVITHQPASCIANDHALLLHAFYHMPSVTCLLSQLDTKPVQLVLLPMRKSKHVTFHNQKTKKGQGSEERLRPEKALQDPRTNSQINLLNASRRLDDKSSAV